MASSTKLTTLEAGDSLDGHIEGSPGLLGLYTPLMTL